MATLSEFSKELCSELPEGSSCLYGHINYRYQAVLVPIQGQILVVGEFIFDFWFKSLYLEKENAHLLKEFKADILSCYNEQIKEVGQSRFVIPSLCYVGNSLVIEKSKSIFHYR